MIVGIDTRSRAMHVAASEKLPRSMFAAPEGTAWFGFFGYSEDKAKGRHPDESRGQLYLDARDLFESLPAGSHVFCEEPLALQNGLTTRLLSMSAGAIWAAFWQTNPDATWYWVDNATWKKAVLGRGSPPRGEKVKPWVRRETLAHPKFVEWCARADHRQLHWETTEVQFERQLDLYDAWCLMEYGRITLAMSPDREKESSEGC